MKKVLLLWIIMLVIPVTLADYGPMMDYGMMRGTGMWFYGFVWFVLVAFLFSIIFWLTYNFIVKEKTKRK